MGDDDSARYVFSTTHWSVVLAAGDADSAEAESALGELCQNYWYPLYAFVRRKGYPQHDAKDLTQGFFEHLLAKDGLSRADPQKGRFRSFLLGSLKNYISVVHRKAGAAKRGGGTTTISIDEEIGEQRYKIEPQDSETPESLFNRSWALDLLDQAQLRLRQRYEKLGQIELYRALSPFITPGEEGITYAQKVEELGMSTSAVTAAIHRLRKAYRRALQEALGEIVADPEEIEDERQFLLSSLQP